MKDIYFFNKMQWGQRTRDTHIFRKAVEKDIFFKTYILLYSQLIDAI